MHVHGPGCGHITRYTDAGRKGRGYKSKHPLERVRFAEKQYAIQLRKLARHIGNLVNGFPAGDPEADAKIKRLLTRYSEILEPWAHSTAGAVVAEIEARDRAAWAEVSATMSRGIQLEIQSAPTGEALRLFLSENVKLITGLPIEAAERVHKLTLEGLVSGTRTAEIAKEIGRTGEVMETHATTIARTAVARTASGLTQVRSEFVGSPGYTWRTSGDAQVRQSHREMEGEFVRWDSPPTLSDGTKTHAGQTWNCRCFADPYLPDIDERPAGYRDRFRRTA